MLKIDEDALICDLAETYQIYDYKQFPALTVAVFSCGLREESRIMLRLSEQTIPLKTLLLADISDKLALLFWAKTDDGQKGKNRPTSVVASMYGQNTVEKSEIVFDSGEEFEQMRQRLIDGGEL
ncbi:DUF5361 domain-containing protein [Enterococcus sp. 22-H-5-01]|uniref:DUF5361 domain-containing protein n=1 Tax=Enterococcus sp. 22-H-5-01 TaxID=3418555 RepID=UPI003D068D47